MKKLTRSNNEKMFAGVCGGLAEYLEIDPTLVRLVFLLLFFFGGNGLLIYLILWILMPPAEIAAPASQAVVDAEPKKK